MRQNRPRNIAAILALSLALVGAACGTEDIPEPAGDAGDPGLEGAPLDVTAADFSFSPDTLSVDTSEEVVITLTNEDDVTHSFTIDELEIDIEASGGSAEEAAVTAPDGDATYSFYCRFHPAQMTGKLIVGTGGSGTDDSETGEGVEENDDGIDY
ncbi:MAG: cupredoxin domain-containing protein [Actinomycetota bacterium]